MTNQISTKVLVIASLAKGKLCPKRSQGKIKAHVHKQNVHVCIPAAQRITGAKWGQKYVLQSMRWSWHQHMNALVLVSTLMH